jgi:hypothetical protein
MDLTVKHIGTKGRFANQMFQYAHLRQRAGEGEYSCPHWTTRRSHNIGYTFPKHSSWYNKPLFKRLFQPVDKWQREIAAEYPDNREYKLLGLHIRRGDYRRIKHRWCFITPLQWYVDCIGECLSNIENLRVYIASDEPNEVYSELSPLCKYPLLRTNPNITDATFWDFLVLTRCDYLMISNSTFGFAASMLNERGKDFWRPKLSARKLVSYNPWNAPLVLKGKQL